MSYAERFEYLLSKLKKYESTLWKLGLSLGLVIALQYGINHFLSTQTGEDFFHEHIVASSIFIILYMSFAHIVTPLFAAPISYASLSIFGVWQTALYTYVAGLISGVIGFWISRKYGRRIVEDFVGKEAMSNVDYFIKHSGTGILIVSRIIGASLFEVISYGFGLTSMSFKKYYTITIFASIIPNVILAWLFQNYNFHKPTSLIFFMVVLGIIEGAYILLIRHQWKNKK